MSERDIVEQLQSLDFCGRHLRDAAADEILSLRAQLAAARDAALEEAALWVETSDIADAADYAFGIRVLKAPRT